MGCDLRHTLNSHREHSTRWGGGSDGCLNEESTRQGGVSSAQPTDSPVFSLLTVSSEGGRSAATTASATRTSSRLRTSSSAVDYETESETKPSTPNCCSKRSRTSDNGVRCRPGRRRSRETLPRSFLRQLKWGVSLRRRTLSNSEAFAIRRYGDDARRYASGLPA